mgnify:CR=1 FL=1
MSNNTVVYTISHAGEEVETAAVATTVTAAEIKAQCVENWPELANATIHIGDEDAANPGHRRVTFSMPTGTKQAA